MQTSSSAEPVADNPRLLAKCHAGVAATYIVLSVFGLGLILFSRELFPDSKHLFPEENIQTIAILAGLFVFGLIHAALAPACARRSEQARRISEFLFSVLILAFPIGTLLSIYLFLPATQWQVPAAESNVEFEP
ncbi:MAG: hypothetical protein LBU11_11780 [Zoogloeaceae bacterium]|nr:hypothetical protein [Zoogloeaceae bacterium]